MPSKTGVFEKSMARNAGKKCSTPTCFNPRTRISSWCTRCNAAVHNHGHPFGRAISHTEYRAETEEVTKFLHAHIKTHKGLQQAQLWIQELFDSAAENSDEAIATREFNRLAAKGVTAFDVLTVWCSLWLFSMRHPHVLPDDERLTFQLSLAAFKLAPQTYRVSCSGKARRRHYSAVDKKALGKLARGCLGVLFFNVADAINNMGRSKVKLKEVLGLPFDDLSPTVVLSA